ncbi:MAG: hydrogenase nickel incorporation protein HypB [Coriobacteriales bacterium]|nr:hydrogenase nickel incorporation protein HypB [Coriobacteriales bacterium]
MTKIDLETKIIDKNDRIAAQNRELLKQNNVCMINLLASPGSGKTSTIIATINALKDACKIAVIEGDIAGDVDSVTIKALGVDAVQINTRGSCHLEADMIAQALDVLDLDKLDLIIVENVGNLVCTTDFDLGEDAKVVILSVPEGDDKPIKYPGIFRESQAIIVNKIDTLSMFDFDYDKFASVVDDLNAQAPIFKIAATKGDGIENWIDWLKNKLKKQ